MKVSEKKQNNKPPLEKEIQTAIVKYLKSEDFSVDVITKGLYGANGIADIIACYHGKYVAFEVKRKPGMKPSALQEAWLSEKCRHGAIAKCVGSVDEVKKIATWLKREV